jgi:hypothetical protein
LREPTDLVEDVTLRLVEPEEEFGFGVETESFFDTSEGFATEPVEAGLCVLSICVNELKPRNANNTNIKLITAFELFFAISDDFLYDVDRSCNAVRPRSSSMMYSERIRRSEARALETV